MHHSGVAVDRSFHGGHICPPSFCVQRSLPNAIAKILGCLGEGGMRRAAENPSKKSEIQKSKT